MRPATALLVFSPPLEHRSFFSLCRGQKFTPANTGSLLLALNADGGPLGFEALCLPVETYLIPRSSPALLQIVYIHNKVRTEFGKDVAPVLQDVPAKVSHSDR